MPGSVDCVSTARHHSEEPFSGSPNAALWFENVSVAYHRKLWSVPNFCSFERIEQLIHSKGEFEIQFHDFTNQVPVRNALLLNISIVILRLILKLGFSKNQNLRTYLGALLLERLYVRKQTSYKVIIASKVR